MVQVQLHGPAHLAAARCRRTARETAAVRRPGYRGHGRACGGRGYWVAQRASLSWPSGLTFAGTHAPGTAGGSPSLPAGAAARHSSMNVIWLAAAASRRCWCCGQRILVNVFLVRCWPGVSAATVAAAVGATAGSGAAAADARSGDGCRVQRDLGFPLHGRRAPPTATLEPVAELRHRRAPGPGRRWLRAGGEHANGPPFMVLITGAGADRLCRRRPGFWP